MPSLENLRIAGPQSCRRLSCRQPSPRLMGGEAETRGTCSRTQATAGPVPPAPALPPLPRPMSSRGLDGAGHQLPTSLTNVPPSEAHMKGAKKDRAAAVDRWTPRFPLGLGSSESGPCSPAHTHTCVYMPTHMCAHTSDTRVHMPTRAGTPSTQEHARTHTRAHSLVHAAAQKPWKPWPRHHLVAPGQGPDPQGPLLLEDLWAREEGGLDQGVPASWRPGWTGLPSGLGQGRAGPGKRGWFAQAQGCRVAGVQGGPSPPRPRVPPPSSPRLVFTVVGPKPAHLSSLPVPWPSPRARVVGALWPTVRSATS